MGAASSSLSGARVTVVESSLSRTVFGTAADCAGCPSIGVKPTLISGGDVACNSEANMLSETLEPDRDPDRPKAWSWDEYERAVVAQWTSMLETDPAESVVQRFLELHPAMIPGGSGDVGPGGHHGSEMSAVFREPRLSGAGRSFRPDFMWITRSTGLVTPVLIEIEKPSKRWFQEGGRPTAAFRDAHDQLNEWRAWFGRSDNPGLFRERFLLEDQYVRRQLRPHFVLIYGRRAEFEPGGGHEDPGSLLNKRDTQQHSDESFMTFDSLRPRHDHGSSVTVTMTANGPLSFAFSPVYGTGTHTLEDSVILGDPADALQRSAMMSDSRKAYLAERWEHWRQIALELAAGRRPVGPRSIGLE